MCISLATMLPVLMEYRRKRAPQVAEPFEFYSVVIFKA